MKYVLTGSAGNITKPLAEQLLKAGHDVTVIGRNAGHLKPLTDGGAKAMIGAIEDVAFLKTAFAGADAVYTMVPPKMNAADWKGYIGAMGENYAEAVKAAGVKYVVNLSSAGAHLPEGAGPVSGLHRAEEALNTLADVNILHLRPGYFYTNFLGSIGMVKHMNIIGSNFGGDGKLVLSHPDDIAAAAAEALLRLDFKGHNIHYIASDERTSADVAKALGLTINKPDLPWIVFSDEQALEGMRQAGLPDEVAKNYVEMGTGLRSGAMAEDYWKHRPQSLGRTKLEDFATQFAGAYHAA
jgi:uncharacterized protein YbjT (DUF2867 family)